MMITVGVEEIAHVITSDAGRWWVAHARNGGPDCSYVAIGASENGLVRLLHHARLTEWLHVAHLDEAGAVKNYRIATPLYALIVDAHERSRLGEIGDMPMYQYIAAIWNGIVEEKKRKLESTRSMTMAKQTKAERAIEAVEEERAMRVRTGFQINLSVHEKTVLAAAAMKAGKPVAVYIREAAIKAAEKASEAER